MTDKEKILAFLEGMSKGCYPNETKEIIINKIIPWINDLPEEPVSEELEEAANKFAISDSPHFINEREYEILIEEKERVFKAGAKWQKEKILKDAIDATITDIRAYKEENEVDFTVMLEKGIVSYELEQEVKVIIIKDE